MNNAFGMQNPQMNNLQNQFAQIQSLYNQLSQSQPRYTAPSQLPANNGILWVDGLEGAKSYHMEPNTTAALFDTNEAVFYLRSLDANGVEAPVKIGRFTLEDAPEPESNVLTKKDLDNFREEIRQMLSQNHQRNFNPNEKKSVQNQQQKNNNQEVK